MTEDQVFECFEEAIKIKGIDKELKKELKETLERVGEYFDFLAKYDIERMIQVPENKKFDPIEVAKFIVARKIDTNPSIVDLEDLVSIAARPKDSMDGPGLNDHELAEKIYNMFLAHDDLDGYNIGNLIITTADNDSWGNKELAIKAAEKGLDEVEDPEALAYIKEVVENESFIGDPELADKIEKKINALK